MKTGLLMILTIGIIGFVGIAFATSEFPPPIKQIQSGAPLHILKCSEDKVILYKNDLSNAACVYEETQIKLVERGWGAKELDFSYQERGQYLCEKYHGQWMQNNETCKDITPKQCSLMGGSYFYSESACTTSRGYYLNNIEDTETSLYGIIVDTNSGFAPSYRFFTNEPYMRFNTGSSGIQLNGLNHHDDLNGKIVSLIGTHAERDLAINVKSFEVLDSFLFSEYVHQDNRIFEITLNELTTNPDLYYNQTINVSGNLKEHENRLAYAGVGCTAARYSTSDEYIPDFPSSRQLYDDEKIIGVRIGTHNDVGKADDSLPDDLKSNTVSVTGLFVPHVVETGACQHVIHKSGYLLTTLDNIKILELKNEN